MRRRLLPFCLIVAMMVSGCGTLSTVSLVSTSDKDEQGRLRIRREKFWFNRCDEPSSFQSIPHAYSGTKKDIVCLLHPCYCREDVGDAEILLWPRHIFAYPLYLVDLPFSLVADTLLLPFTAYQQHEHGDLIDPSYFKIGMEAKDNDRRAEYYERGMQVLPKYYPGEKLSEIYGGYYFDSSVEYLAEYYNDKKDYEKAFYYYQIVLKMDARKRIDRPYRRSKALHVCAELGKIDFAKGVSCYEMTNALLQQKKH